MAGVGASAGGKGSPVKSAVVRDLMSHDWSVTLIFHDFPDFRA